MARNELRNDRQAAFKLADDVTRNAPNMGANFLKPGPQRDRSPVSRFPVWAWVALTILAPVGAFALYFFKG